MGKGKPHGLNAGRKLRTLRKKKRWGQQKYIKRLGGSAKHNPFGRAPCASGIVVEKIAVEAKQPNSACRKCVRVQLKKNGRGITAFVPLDGSLDYIDENDRVLCAGLGRRGKAVGDLPGVRFKVVHVAGLGLRALFLKKKDKPRGGR